jgi:hypothetical protein
MGDRIGNLLLQLKRTPEDRINMIHQKKSLCSKKAVLETDCTRLYERYLAICLHLEGRSFAAIADILGASMFNIYWNDDQANGTSGLDCQNVKKIDDPPSNLVR